MEIAGVEPATSWLPVKRSSQLSYTPNAINAAANIEYFFKKNPYSAEKITGKWSIIDYSDFSYLVPESSLEY